MLLSAERASHIAVRRLRDVAFCVEHMPLVLIDPQFVGQRSHGDRRRVEFVRSVGPERRLLVVAVKFLDVDDEAWVNSAYPWNHAALTRRLRNGTIWKASRGP